MAYLGFPPQYNNHYDIQKQKIELVQLASEDKRPFSKNMRIAVDKIISEKKQLMLL